ncbi:hypothetical protein ACQUFY_10840 [Robbsia andropogonis]|uniref:hypothetical protein n=1 Tax=Robbsia andropogonis TaxID=28092 RepID=UPI003D22C622
MTIKAILTVTAGDASTAVASPTGLAAGKTRFTFLAADGSTIQTVDVDGLTTSVDLDTAPAKGSAQLLDTAGAPIFDALTADFVDGDTPTAVTATPLGSLTATYTTV